MAWLQRPPTLKEFVIHSLLRPREPAATIDEEMETFGDRDTLVDTADKAPTLEVEVARRPSEPEVFDVSWAART